MKAIGARAVDHSYAILLGLFVVIRLVLFAIGCRFDSGNLTTWWQIADVELLRHDLANTLWYLHSQPPLFNLLIGLGLKAGDGAFPWIMDAVFGLVTLGGILAFNGLARIVTGRPGIALAAAAWLCVSPATLLFSTRLYYDSLLPGLFCMAFWCVQRGLDRRSIAWLGAGFGWLAVVVLLRSMMHPLFYLIVIATILALAWGERRRILIAALAPTIAIALVMIKNAFVFGTLGLSSWGPLNLSATMGDGLPAPLRAELIASGRMSPLMQTWAFAPIATYRHLLPLPAPTGQPSLDNPLKSTGGNNYNNAIYLKIAAIRGPDAIAAMRARPAQIAIVFAKSFYYFHRPASDFKGLDNNRARIAAWNRISKAVLLIEPAAWIESGTGDFRRSPWLHIGYATLFGTLCFLAALPLYGRRLWQIARGRDRARPGEPVFAAILLLATMLFLVSSLFDVTENNRAHYAFGPLMMLGVLWLLFGRKRFPGGQSAAVIEAVRLPPLSGGPR